MTTIKDPVLDPYYVSKDNHGYTIYETVTPDSRYLEEGSEGKDYVKTICHPSTFGRCLTRIIEMKLNNDTDYSSISEYLNRYNKISEKVKNAIKVEL